MLWKFFFFFNSFNSLKTLKFRNPRHSKISRFSIKIPSIKLFITNNNKYDIKFLTPSVVYKAIVSGTNKRDKKYFRISETSYKDLIGTIRGILDTKNMLIT